MYKFEIGQKLQIYGCRHLVPDSILEGMIVTVKELPGYDGSKGEEGIYNVVTPGSVSIPVMERFLRPFPPILPNGRGDIDTKSTWPEFEAATGIKLATLRGNPDY